MYGSYGRCWHDGTVGVRTFKGRPTRICVSCLRCPTCRRVAIALAADIAPQVARVVGVGRGPAFFPFGQDHLWCRPRTVSLGILYHEVQPEVAQPYRGVGRSRGTASTAGSRYCPRSACHSPWIDRSPVSHHRYGLGDRSTCGRSPRRIYRVEDHQGLPSASQRYSQDQDARSRIGTWNESRFGGTQRIHYCRSADRSAGIGRCGCPRTAFGR